MSTPTAFRYWLLTFLLCCIAIVVCIQYVDRTVAEFFEAHLRHTEVWIWLNRMLYPLNLAVVIVLFFMFGCGIWLLSGRRLHPWTETPLLCSWSAIWAIAAEIILKRIFGRAWPDPTYVQNHIYGFHFLHGGPNWESFPSGTAAISASIASVLWITNPNWRVILLLIVILPSGAVVVGNYHWLSDVIAGAFLGAFIGWSTVRFNNPGSSATSK